MLCLWCSATTWLQGAGLRRRRCVCTAVRVVINNGEWEGACEWVVVGWGGGAQVCTLVRRGKVRGVKPRHGNVGSLSETEA